MPRHCSQRFQHELFYLWLNRSNVSTPSLRHLDHIYLDTSHLVGLLWKSDQPVTETPTWQHKTLIGDRSPGGIWTQNPSKSVGIDPGLRPHCHWDQPTWSAVIFMWDIPVCGEYKLVQKSSITHNKYKILLFIKNNSEHEATCFGSHEPKHVASCSPLFLINNSILYLLCVIDDYLY